jgi:hypothetical protein
MEKTIQITLSQLEALLRKQRESCGMCDSVDAATHWEILNAPLPDLSNLKEVKRITWHHKEMSIKEVTTEKENDLEKFDIVGANAKQDEFGNVTAEFVLQERETYGASDNATSTVPCDAPFNKSNSVEASFHEVRRWAKFEFEQQFHFEKNDALKWMVWKMAYHRGFRQAEMYHQIYKQPVKKASCTHDPNTCQVVFCGWPHKCDEGELLNTEQGVQECDASKAQSTGEPLANNTTEGKVTE